MKFIEPPKTMDIKSPKWSKVRFSFPDNGMDCDQELARDFLELGQVYTVEFIDVQSSSSTVYLMEKVIGFNTVLFENVIENEGEKK